MNDRINDILLDVQKSVALLSNSNAGKQKIVYHKFAEAILSDCISVVNDGTSEGAAYAMRIKNIFGVK